MSKKKKRNTKVKKTNVVAKKSHKPLIIISLIAVAIVICVVVLCIVFRPVDKAEQLQNTQWVSSSGTTSTGDEVDVRDIYSTSYTTYEGTLSFKDESNFELWLSPGDPDDGSHKGTYELSGDIINVTYDSGDATQFTINYKSGSTTDIESILVPYGDYIVCFTAKKN